MSTGFLENVMSNQRPASMYHLAESHKKHSHVVQETPDGKLMNPKVASTTTAIQNNEMLSFSTASNTASIFGSSGQSVDIRVPTQGLHIIKEVILQVDLVNNDPGAITFISLPHLIQRLEVYTNDGNERVNQVPGNVMVNHHLFTLSEEQLTKLGLASGPFNGTITLAPAETRTLYYPLRGTFFDTCQIFGAGLTGDLLLRVYFEGTVADITTLGASTPTMNSCSAIFRCNELSPKEYREMIQEYKNETKDFKYIDYLENKLVQTYSPGTEYTQQLGGVNGLVPFLYINMRASPIQGAGFYTYETLQDFNLLSHNSQTITGLPRVTADLIEGIEFPANFSGQNPGRGRYFWSHTESFEHELQTGAMLGCYAYDGKSQLVIRTPTAGFVAGVKSLEVIACVKAMLRVKNGSVSILRT